MDTCARCVLCAVHFSGRRWFCEDVRGACLAEKYIVGNLVKRGEWRGFEEIGGYHEAWRKKGNAGDFCKKRGVKQINIYRKIFMEKIGVYLMLL